MSDPVPDPAAPPRAELPARALPVLLAATAPLHLRTLGFEFIHDDLKQLRDNPVVQDGGA